MVNNVKIFKIVPYDSQPISGFAVNIFCITSVRLEFNAIHNCSFHGIHLIGCEDLTFKDVKNLTLTNVMHSSLNGLHLIHVNADIIDCSFNAHFVTQTSNKTVCGGAIAVYHSNASIIRSYFEANTAEQGGAIYQDSESNITILDSTFVRNQGNTGGVVFSGSKCTLVIKNTSFIDNSATVSGGAIFAMNSNVSICLSMFVMNKGERFGGALYLNAVVITVQDCKFDKNIVMDDDNGTSVTIIGCELLQYLIPPQPGNDTIDLNVHNIIFIH